MKATDIKRAKAIVKKKDENFYLRFSRELSNGSLLYFIVFKLSSKTVCSTINKKFKQK